MDGVQVDDPVIFLADRTVSLWPVLGSETAVL